MTVARSRFLAVAVGAAISCLSSDISAQNLAIGRPVIDGSGSWDGGVIGVGAPFDSGTFPALLVTDGNKNEATNAPVSYWLGQEGVASSYFTLDLGELRNIDEVRLFNTHNRQSNDRGTDEFVLYGATAVDGLNQLISPVPILSGNLANVTGQVDIVGDIFGTANGLVPGAQARYLRFDALTSTYGNNNVGLNEIEIYDFGFVNPNRAAGKPIIDGSGAYPADPFLSGAFPASNATNDSFGEAGGDFWLGREGIPTEYFTLDLQEVMSIAEITLRNTHNRQFDDRGTRDFRILASDTIDGSNQLVDPQVVLEGRLPNNAGLGGAPATVFTAANGLIPTDARYLRFESLSAHYEGINTGLNEIEVYNTEMHPPSELPREGNVAAHKPVVDGSGSWDGGVQCVGQPFNAGTFPAGRVTDESMADANTGRTSYWLGREFCDNEYFTIDLEGIFDLDEVVLRNAHNTQFNDRGTGEFIIYGATELDGANQLVDQFVVTAGDLTNTAGQTILTADTFAIGDDVPPARYLKFQALTYLSSATNGSAGLNEFEVYGTVIPEPGTTALAIVGLGCVCVFARRRRGV
jgi:hypothetical protein